MKIKLEIVAERRKHKVVILKTNATVLDLLKKLKYLPDSWIPLKNNTPIPLDTVLKSNDSIKLVSVVSGG